MINIRGVSGTILLPSSGDYSAQRFYYVFRVSGSGRDDMWSPLDIELAWFNC
jgi:hypothetical protein